MFDFREKQAIGRMHNVIDSYIFYNKDYVPFSLLFNLNNNVNSIMTFERFFSIRRDGKYSTLYFNNLEKLLREWIEMTPHVINTCAPNYYASITDLNNMVANQLFFSEIRIARTSYHLGYYTLMDWSIQQCYFMLVVKKEYSEYVKLCALTGEPVLEDCYEFWYDPKALETDPRAKRVCNKLIKELTTMEIPCFEKEKIISLLVPKLEFKAPTISRQKEMVAEFVDSYQEYEDIKLNGKR